MCARVGTALSLGAPAMSSSFVRLSCLLPSARGAEGSPEHTASGFHSTAKISAVSLQAVSKGSRLLGRNLGCLRAELKNARCRVLPCSATLVTPALPCSIYRERAGGFCREGPSNAEPAAQGHFEIMAQGLQM